MDEKLTFYLYYHDEDNLFTDDDGHIVFDLFTIITPQDLFMFRHDHDFNTFPMKGQPDVECKIIPISDYQIIGRYEMSNWLGGELMAVGDDYERIERYEEAKLYGDNV